MPALERSEAEIVIVADADVWTDGLPEAVAAVKNGAAWAMPHRLVRRLNEDSTARYLAGETEDLELEQLVYRGVWGGGYIVARRETLLTVPLDPRFVGWGGEDESWALALHTLAGPGWRGGADLVHCWHPPQERWTRRRGSRASWKLYGRYRAARDDIAAMRGLISEGRALARTQAERGGIQPCLSPA